MNPQNEAEYLRGKAKVRLRHASASLHEGVKGGLNTAKEAFGASGRHLIHTNRAIRQREGVKAAQNIGLAVGKGLVGMAAVPAIGLVGGPGNAVREAGMASFDATRSVASTVKTRVRNKGKMHMSTPTQEEEEQAAHLRNKLYEFDAESHPIHYFGKSASFNDPIEEMQYPVPYKKYSSKIFHLDMRGAHQERRSMHEDTRLTKRSPPKNKTGTETSFAKARQRQHLQLAGESVVDGVATGIVSPYYGVKASGTHFVNMGKAVGRADGSRAAAHLALGVGKLLAAPVVGLYPAIKGPVNAAKELTRAAKDAKAHRKLKREDEFEHLAVSDEEKRSNDARYEEELDRYYRENNPMKKSGAMGGPVDWLKDTRCNALGCIKEAESRKRHNSRSRH
ncbi:hypothetical protein CBS101457_004859 [Exobasidium rhododendri]|nr:hypothetical protein CBS101457_004859 [Exobasidium rhododendri]